MFHYKAFGLEISSEIELPGMTRGSDNPDVRIIKGEVDPLQVTQAEVEGPNYLVKEGDVYFWWDDIGKVKISKGKLITVDPITDLTGSDEVNLIPFLLGPVMALLLHQQGFLVLHGSSVKVKEGAVAFLGHRGNGKSTTAINLYKDGYPLVTDDILAMKFTKKGRPVVYPGYPHVRLGEDSYNHVKDNTDILTPIRTIVGNLKTIYLLERGDNIRISSLKSQENLIDLIMHSVANRIFQHTTQKENLMHCAQLVNNVRLKQLEITHSFQKIQELVKMIEDDLKNGD